MCPCVSSEGRHFACHRTFGHRKRTTNRDASKTQCLRVLRGVTTRATAFEAAPLIKPPALPGVSDACRACPTARRCESSTQPDGGEGLAKRKGGHREVASEGSVEQRREPMHKNRIGGVRDRTSGREVAKSISVKGPGRKSGGCAPKAVGLTPGGLRRCPRRGTEGTERNPERGAGVSRRHSRWWKRAGIPEVSPHRRPERPPARG